MAKAVKVKVKLESTAGTGTFYLAEKNPRTHPEKLTLKKYDKKSKKHEEFVEKKFEVISEKIFRVKKEGTGKGIFFFCTVYGCTGQRQRAVRQHPYITVVTVSFVRGDGL